MYDQNEGLGAAMAASATRQTAESAEREVLRLRDALAAIERRVAHIEDFLVLDPAS